MAWQEYPSPAFLTSSSLVLLGLLSGILGLTGIFDPRPPNAADGLIGLTAARTRDLLGTPATVRHEPPAEVWQYRSDACVLDVYVYEESRTPLVKYAEARDQPHPAPDNPGCLETLRLAALR